MSDFKTPIPHLLARFMQTSINQLLALDDGIDQRVAALENKSLTIELQGLNLPLAFRVADGEFRVSAEYDEDADTVIRGTPQALFSMAMPDWGSSQSTVEIQGNANLARDLEQLFRKLDPDWEAPLTRIFGDVLGHQLAVGARESGRWLKSSAASTQAMLRDYLTEESGLTPHPKQAERFHDSVDDLRDAVDRLEARIRRLEENRP